MKCKLTESQKACLFMALVVLAALGSGLLCRHTLII
jgi:hypothetical protein